eukprot:TRINITY_DN42719_c0_g1_i1.p2 TRINITY_DN42719_c0_g1~~TRINITY_DN42719_c0_g1_i1.p2  ORF type:complete len:129 (+),score=17.08 TRINITY_DN42719_c0_g1_i1:425-811(+)
MHGPATEHVADALEVAAEVSGGQHEGGMLKGLCPCELAAHAKDRHIGEESPEQSRRHSLPWCVHSSSRKRSSVLPCCLVADSSLEVSDTMFAVSKTPPQDLVPHGDPLKHRVAKNAGEGAETGGACAG